MYPREIDDIDAVDEVNASNPPDWMVDGAPKMMQTASEIAARLVAEGYSEEQAYEIALERLQDEENIEEDTIHTVEETDLAGDVAASDDVEI
jgi:uncharacterized protein YdaT